MDKKNWRRDELATRIDLRMPNEIYDRVVEIATAAGEKINPKSGQVRLTATLIKLIEVGMEHLSDSQIKANRFSFGEATPTGADAELVDRLEDLEDKYRELQAEISTIKKLSAVA